MNLGISIDNNFSKRKRFLTEYDKDFFRKNEKYINIIFKDRDKQLFFNTQKDISNLIKYNVPWEIYRDICLVNDFAGDVYLSCLRMLKKKIEVEVESDQFLFEWFNGISFTFNDNGLRDKVELFMELFRKKIAQKMASMDDTDMLSLFENEIGITLSHSNTEIRVPKIRSNEYSEERSFSVNKQAIVDLFDCLGDFFHINKSATYHLIKETLGYYPQYQKEESGAYRLNSYAMSPESFIKMLLSNKSLSHPSLIFDADLSEFYNSLPSNKDAILDVAYGGFLCSKSNKIASEIKDVWPINGNLNISISELNLVDDISFLESKGDSRKIYL